MPEYYLFLIDNDNPQCLVSGGTSIYNSPGPTYTLNKSGIVGLQQFLQNTRLPFVDFVQLAFDNFEFSYETHKTEISFLSLMIALEILFNRGKDGELAYSISRNAAVLLGDDRDDAENVFKDIKKFYQKKSAIVHAGKAEKKKPLLETDLLKLRYYVRRSIKELCNTYKSKDDVLSALNSNGFGSKPFRMS